VAGFSTRAVPGRSCETLPPGIPTFSGFATPSEARGRVSCLLVPAVFLLLSACKPPGTASDEAVKGKRRDGPRAAYAAAIQRHESDASFESAADLARKAIRLLDERWDDLTREEHTSILKEGLDAAVRAGSLEPERVEGHYYLAALTGLKARSTGVLGKRTIARIESYCRDADLRDPSYDSAGASRLLGILLRKAPGRKRNLSRSREMLERAVKLAPDSALNHLELALTLAAMGHMDAARKEFSQYEALRTVVPPASFIAKEEAAARKALVLPPYADP